ncbi:MAG: NUDIX hydrolase [Pseudomonadota bacterium]
MGVAIILTHSIVLDRLSWGIGRRDMSKDFSGSKIALFCGDELLVYLRDDFEHIPFPGCWDLPGGGREGEESPEACALRELEEEFGLILSKERIVWKQRYESSRTGGLPSYFFVADITQSEISEIEFGSEGQRWEMAPVQAFLKDEDAILHLVERITDYLDDMKRDSS